MRHVLALVKNPGKRPKLTMDQARSMHQRVHALLLDRLPLAELRRRIAHFRLRTFGSMNYQDVQKAVGDVVYMDAVDSEKIAPISWISDYRDQGLLLYRARKDVIPLEFVSDCWSPPPAKARANRLNREGEPLLYTSADGPKVVVDEIDAKPGAAVSIIVYRAKQRLKLTALGAGKDYGYLNAEQREKQTLLFAFLASQFVQAVPTGSEYLYMISQVIARKYWGMDGEEDGWLYPSIKSGTFPEHCIETGKGYEEAATRRGHRCDSPATKCG